MDRRSHWENIYHAKPATEVSWFEAEPTTSLSLIQSVAPTGGRIIDVGGGTSLLVDRLLAAGNWNVTVLDISATALELAQARLHKLAKGVQWIQADITQVQTLGTYDVWHDRAVFHFLKMPEDRAAYLLRLYQALRPGGYAIFGTFAPQGPEKCSGLPVCRYDAQSLTATLGKDFSLVKSLDHSHCTPAGKTQLFSFSLFQKAEM